jgi:hypothetical protein
MRQEFARAYARGDETAAVELNGWLRARGA